MTATTAPPPAPADIPGVTRRHRFSDLYHERTNFQFIKHSKRWAILSGVLILLSFVALFTRGLNFGIDFEGGTSWQVRMASGQSAHVAEVRDALRGLGFADAKVSILSGRNGQSVNVQEHVVTDPIDTELLELLDIGGTRAVFGQTRFDAGIIGCLDAEAQFVDALGERQPVLTLPDGDLLQHAPNVRIGGRCGPRREVLVALALAHGNTVEQPQIARLLGHPQFPSLHGHPSDGPTNGR